MNHTLFKVAPFAIAVAVALAACGKKEEAAPKAEPAKAAAAPAAEIIKIGHVAPLTGGIAHLGKDNENGARLAVEADAPFGGPRIVRAGGHRVAIARRLARLVRVVPVGEERASPESAHR